MPVDLLDRLVIIRTLPYTLAEMVQILAIRAQVGRGGRVLRAALSGPASRCHPYLLPWASWLRCHLARYPHVPVPRAHSILTAS